MIIIELDTCGDHVGWLLGGWGKRENGWNNLKGLWGKRASSQSWNRLGPAWGKRSEITVDPVSQTSNEEPTTVNEN